MRLEHGPNGVLAAGWRAAVLFTDGPEGEWGRGEKEGGEVGRGVFWEVEDLVDGQEDKRGWEG